MILNHQPTHANWVARFMVAHHVQRMAVGLLVVLLLYMLWRMVTAGKHEG